MTNHLDQLLELAWRSRDGTENRVRYYGGSIDEARAHAATVGCPGHSGKWWNYLLDDVRAFVARLR